jgi:hypothetical protein
LGLPTGSRAAASTTRFQGRDRSICHPR